MYFNWLKLRLPRNLLFSAASSKTGITGTLVHFSFATKTVVADAISCVQRVANMKTTDLKGFCASLHIK